MGNEQNRSGKKPAIHGISLDEKAQEQPTDKARAQQASRRDRGGDPPGEKAASSLEKKRSGDGDPHRR
jgi:hypothetical protein